MSINEREPGIERTRKDVIVHVPTAEVIFEALPPTISIEDRKAIAESTLEFLKQHDEETKKEHAEVVKALDEEKEGRKTEHDDAVKWRQISIVLAVLSVLLAFISIYLGYLAP
ncbi:MAG TPA: hypothetical protein VIH90_07200 [Candidatus Saccharimonadales bacterium]|jgi:hypothetical protein